MLPKKLIRCYRSQYLFSPAMVENEKRLKQLHPEPAWEHLFFNHQEARDWVAANMPDWKELYDFYPVDRQREQVFRWLVIWKLGGFWLSTEMRPIEPFDSLLNRSLALGVRNRMDNSEFEERHQSPVHPEMSELAKVRISDSVFASEAGHWFPKMVLETLIERAGHLDTTFEPRQEEEEFTTGAGVANAAWLACLEEGRNLDAVLVPDGNPESKVRGTSTAEWFGKYCYRHTGLID